jgi:hypothetical protein
MEDRDYFDYLYQGWSQTTGGESSFWMPEECYEGGVNLFSVDESQKKHPVGWLSLDNEPGLEVGQHRDVVLAAAGGDYRNRIYRRGYRMRTGWGRDPDKWLITKWGGVWNVYEPHGPVTHHWTGEAALAHYRYRVRCHLAEARAKVDVKWLEHIEDWHGKTARTA